MKKSKRKIPGLWLLVSSGAVRIDHENILYCHHIDDFTKIVFLNGHFSRVQVPLRQLEEKLGRKKFYRCHRNFLINLDQADSKCLQDDYTLRLSGRWSVPVARRRKNELLIMLDKNNSQDDISA